MDKPRGRKPRGRKQLADPELAKEIRETWNRGKKPNGEGYTVQDLRRLYRIGETTIRNIINEKGVYKKC